MLIYYFYAIIPAKEYYDIVISHINKKTNTPKEATEKLFYILNQAMNLDQDSRVVTKLAAQLSEYKNLVKDTDCIVHTLN